MKSKSVAGQLRMKQLWWIQTEKKGITAENQKAAGKEYEQEEHNGNKIFFLTEEMIFQGKLPKEDFYPLYAVR